VYGPKCQCAAAITHDLRQPLTALEMNIAAARHVLRAGVQLEGALESLHDALDQQCRMRESLRGLATRRSTTSSRPEGLVLGDASLMRQAC
jgi:C4-dicarboxylate-specific signal transduction histidine kinase